MGRPSSSESAAGVREVLIAKLAGHVRLTVDPRMHWRPKEEWPDPMPEYVDSTADLYDDLVAGRAVKSVPAFMVPRELGLVPPGVWSVDIAVDGTVTATPYERLR